MKFILFLIVAVLFIGQVLAFSQHDVEECLSNVRKNNLLSTNQKTRMVNILNNERLSIDERVQTYLEAYISAIKTAVMDKPYSDEDKQILISILDDRTKPLDARMRDFEDQLETTNLVATARAMIELLRSFNGVPRNQWPEPQQQQPRPPVSPPDQPISYSRLGRDRALDAKPTAQRDTECMICFQTPEECPSQFYSTQCKHSACKDCLRAYAISKRDSSVPVNCPMCRQNIELNLNE